MLIRDPLCHEVYIVGNRISGSRIEQFAVVILPLQRIAEFGRFRKRQRFAVVDPVRRRINLRAAVHVEGHLAVSCLPLSEESYILGEGELIGIVGVACAVLPAVELIALNGEAASRFVNLLAKIHRNRIHGAAPVRAGGRIGNEGDGIRLGSPDCVEGHTAVDSVPVSCVIQIPGVVPPLQRISSLRGIVERDPRSGIHATNNQSFRGRSGGDISLEGTAIEKECDRNLGLFFPNGVEGGVRVLIERIAIFILNKVGFLIRIMCPTDKRISVSPKCVGRQRHIGFVCPNEQWIHLALAAVGVERDDKAINPLALFHTKVIIVSGHSVRSSRERLRCRGVFQLRRGNWNVDNRAVVFILRSGCQLPCFGFKANLAGSAGADDLRAACRGIEIIADNQSAVNVHYCVHKVRIRTGIRHAWRICDRQEM